MDMSQSDRNLMQTVEDILKSEGLQYNHIPIRNTVFAFDMKYEILSFHIVEFSDKRGAVVSQSGMMLSQDSLSMVTELPDDRSKSLHFDILMLLGQRESLFRMDDSYASSHWVGVQRI